PQVYAKRNTSATLPADGSVTQFGTTRLSNIIGADPRSTDEILKLQQHHHADVDKQAADRKRYHFSCNGN
ncbi:MAG: hypothetical protein ABI729_06445, partial [Chitinophagales bacterium]